MSGECALFWDVSFEKLEPADSVDGFNAIRIVCVADEKPVLNAHCDYGAYVGCSFGLRKVSVEVDQKSMTPRCSGLAAVCVVPRNESFQGSYCLYKYKLLSL
jgi:hypothetical protein